MEYMQMQDRTIEEMKINSALRNRTIYLNEEVSAESMFKFCYYLNRIQENDIKNNIPKDKLEPINIIIQSFGGSIYDGLMAIMKLEEMMSNGYHIISTTYYAMSMGQAIAMVSNHRRGYSHSRIMIHQPSSYAYGKLKDMEEDVEETKLLWIKMKELIKKYTKLTEEQLEEIKRSKTDFYVWGTQALELGIIDEIL